MSERWQQEVAETIFDVVNQDVDRIEQKRRQKPKADDEESGELCWPRNNLESDLSFKQGFCNETSL